MDENNQAAPIAQASPDGGGNNNKMKLWTVAGVVIILLVVGGVYFYMTSSQKATSDKSAPTKTPQAQENLESELNKIKVGDLDEEFSEVDKDLRNL